MHKIEDIINKIHWCRDQPRILQDSRKAFTEHTGKFILGGDMPTPSEERVCMRCKEKFRSSLKTAYRHCPKCRKWINMVGKQPFAGGISLGRKDEANA